MQQTTSRTELDLAELDLTETNLIETDITDAGAVVMLALGTCVEVRRRFDHAWARGFEIESTAPDGYRLRRQSDGAVLPVSFPRNDVRRLLV